MISYLISNCTCIGMQRFSAMVEFGEMPLSDLLCWLGESFNNRGQISVIAKLNVNSIATNTKYRPSNDFQ